MSQCKCIIINIRSAIVLIFIFFLSGIKQSLTAINLMEVDMKTDVQKNNTVDNVPVRIVKNMNETFSCPTDEDCINLKFPCIRCSYNYSCIYGKDLNVTCEVAAQTHCQGERSFIKLINCRYCYQTEVWQQTCVQRGNCNSIDQYYKTNCTANSEVICLGNRTFSKNVKCNWTQGYQWGSALLISLTLGGFGADRFYLGHWQEGIGKLFSFGGLGVWTIIDVLLISLHYLGPADGSLYI